MTHSLFRLGAAMLLLALCCAPVRAITYIDQWQNGFDGVNGLGGAMDTVVSPDGKFVYATGFSQGTVAAFARDASDGKLTFRAFYQNGSGVSGLTGAYGLAISPDGAHLFVAGYQDNTLSSFTRNTMTGALTQLELHKNDVVFQTITDVAVSPDGLRVYTTSSSGHSVSVLTRDPATGALVYNLTRSEGVDGVAGVNGAGEIAVSPDSRFIYVAGETSNAIAAFERGTGNELAYIGAYTGQGASAPYGLAMSPDGGRLYLTATTSNTVTVLTRDGNTGALTFLSQYQNGSNGITGLNYPWGVVASPDNQRVYVTGRNASALAVFDVYANPSTTGGLHYVETQLSSSQSDQPLNGATGLSVSPDSGHLYVAANLDNAVSLYSNFSADLSLSLTDTLDPAEVNASLTYNATITNLGPTASGPVAFTFTLPSGTTFQSVSNAGCSSQGTSVTCPALASLNAGQQHVISIQLQAPSAATSITASASVSGTSPDGITSNNQASQATTIQAQVAKADLVVGLTENADPVNLGSPLTYTLTLQNNGPAPASEVSAELTGLDPSITGVQTDTSCTYASADNKVTCAIGSVAVGNTISRTLTFNTPNTEKTLTAQAIVTMAEQDPDASTPLSATVSTEVKALSLDIGVLAHFAQPAAPRVGESLEFVAQIVNNGPHAATGVTFTNTLPAGVQYQSHRFNSAISADKDQDCSVDAGILTCQLGVVDVFGNVGTAHTVFITTTPLANGAKTNTVQVTTTATDTNSANNESQTTVNISGQVADLALELVADPESILQNGTVTFSNMVHNGGSDTATDLTVSNDIQGGTVVEITADGWNCTSGAAFTCTRATLAASGSALIQTKVLGSQLGKITYQASVTGNPAFYDPGTPNSATKEVAVTNISTDLALTASATPTAPLTGQPISVALSVENKGTQTASGISVTYEVPDNLLYQSFQAAQGSCSEVNGVVTCDLLNLGAGLTTGATLELVANQAGTFKNTFNLSSTSFDPTVDNNSAEVDLTVAKATADLSLTIGESQDPLVVDNELTYLVTVANAGPHPASNTQLTLTVPTEAVFVSVQSSQGAACRQNGASVTCALGSIPANGNATASLSVQARQAGTLVFAAEVAADEEDPDATGGKTTISEETRVNEPQQLVFISDYTHGLNGVGGLNGASAVAISGDGRHVYACGFNGNSLAIFQRDATSGALSFLQALSNAGGIQHLIQPSSVAVSEDGTEVYVTSYGDSALLVFRRNGATGLLDFSQALVDGEAGVETLGLPFDVVNAGDYVYTASIADQAISVFRREGNGVLSLANSYREGVDGIEGLAGVTALAISPDGGHLYAAALESHALTVFTRNADSLTYVQTLRDGVDGVTGLTGAIYVAPGPNNRYVYVAGNAANALAVFERGANGLSFIQSLTALPGLSGISAVAVSPDGNTLYTAATTLNALGVFTRNATSGGFDATALVSDGDNGVNGLAGAQEVVVSTDGGHIYVAGNTDNALAAFRVSSADLSVEARADKTSTTVNETVTLTATVKNNGPDQANGVTFVNTLPDFTQLQAAQASKGAPCTQAGNAVSCNLGLLEPGTSAQIEIQLIALQHGALTNTMSVAGNQYDPNASNNTTSQALQAVGNADVGLNLRQETVNPVLGGELQYTVVVTNQGPNDAHQPQLEAVLPPSVRFVSGQGCVEDAGTVRCEFDTLGNQQSQSAAFVLEPQAIGNLTVEATVAALENDLVTDNNRASVTLEVQGNEVTESINNTGNTLKNRVILEGVVVTGGNVAGTIDNRGVLFDVSILADAVVTGGRLAGNITNQGIVENVTLNGDASVNGGVLRGEITGDTDGVSSVNGRVLTGSRLSFVTIGSAATLDAGVVIGPGVTFQDNATIPVDLDVTAAFPALLDGVTGGSVITLDSDLVKGTPTLLEQINAIPGFAEAGLVFTQNARNQLSVTYQGILFTALPTRIRQSAKGVGLYNQHDGSVEFVTYTHRSILAQPAINQAEDLLAVLQAAGMTEISAVGDSGNYSVTFDPQTRFVFRPDLMATPDTSASAYPLQPMAAPLTGREHLRWHFTTPCLVSPCVDTRYQQPMYPAAAFPDSLIAAINTFPGARDATLHHNGVVTVSIGVTRYQGLLDYPVVRGDNPGGITQLIGIADVNGDGMDDLRVVYPNGESQTLMVFPPIDTLAELRAIPELANAGMEISQTDAGLLLLRDGNVTRLLQPAGETQIGDGATASMIRLAQGGIQFTTASGKVITTWPALQGADALNQTLATLASAVLITSTEAGNLLLDLDASQYTLRPATDAYPTSQTPGLYSVATASGPGIEFRQVFLDDQGQAREQALYPAPLYADQLQAFLTNLSGGQATFGDNGELTANGPALRGQFGYFVEALPPSGGLSLQAIADQNQDGHADYRVVYPDGKAQILYTLP